MLNFLDRLFEQNSAPSISVALAIAASAVPLFLSIAFLIRHYPLCCFAVALVASAVAVAAIVLLRRSGLKVRSVRCGRLKGLKFRVGSVSVSAAAVRCRIAQRRWPAADAGRRDRADEDSSRHVLQLIADGVQVQHMESAQPVRRASPAGFAPARSQPAGSLPRPVLLTKLAEALLRLLGSRLEAHVSSLDIAVSPSLAATPPGDAGGSASAARATASFRCIGFLLRASRVAPTARGFRSHVEVSCASLAASSSWIAAHALGPGDGVSLANVPSATIAIPACKALLTLESERLTREQRAAHAAYTRAYDAAKGGPEPAQVRGTPIAAVGAGRFRSASNTAAAGSVLAPLHAALRTLQLWARRPFYRISSVSLATELQPAVESSSSLPARAAATAGAAIVVALHYCRDAPAQLPERATQPSAVTAIEPTSALPSGDTLPRIALPSRLFALLEALQLRPASRATSAAEALGGEWSPLAASPTATEGSSAGLVEPQVQADASLRRLRLQLAPLLPSLSLRIDRTPLNIRATADFRAPNSDVQAAVAAVADERAYRASVDVHFIGSASVSAGFVHKHAEAARPAASPPVAAGSADADAEQARLSFAASLRCAAESVATEIALCFSPTASSASAPSGAGAGATSAAGASQGVVSTQRGGAALRLKLAADRLGLESQAYAAAAAAKAGPTAAHDGPSRATSSEAGGMSDVALRLFVAAAAQSPSCHAFAPSGNALAAAALATVAAVRSVLPQKQRSSTVSSSAFGDTAALVATATEQQGLVERQLPLRIQLQPELAWSEASGICQMGSRAVALRLGHFRLQPGKSLSQAVPVSSPPVPSATGPGTAAGGHSKQHAIELTLLATDASCKRILPAGAAKLALSDMATATASTAVSPSAARGGRQSGAAKSMLAALHGEAELSRFDCWLITATAPPAASATQVTVASCGSAPPALTALAVTAACAEAGSSISERPLPLHMQLFRFAALRVGLGQRETREAGTAGRRLDASLSSPRILVSVPWMPSVQRFASDAAVAAAAVRSLLRKPTVASPAAEAATGPSPGAVGSALPAAAVPHETRSGGAASTAVAPVAGDRLHWTLAITRAGAELQSTALFDDVQLPMPQTAHECPLHADGDAAPRQESQAQAPVLQGRTPPRSGSSSASAQSPPSSAARHRKTVLPAPPPQPQGLPALSSGRPASRACLQLTLHAATIGNAPPGVSTDSAASAHTSVAAGEVGPRLMGRVGPLVAQLLYAQQPSGVGSAAAAASTALSSAQGGADSVQGTAAPDAHGRAMDAGNADMWSAPVPLLYLGTSSVTLSPSGLQSSAPRTCDVQLGPLHGDWSLASHLSLLQLGLQLKSQLAALKAAVTRVRTNASAADGTAAAPVPAAASAPSSKSRSVLVRISAPAASVAARLGPRTVLSVLLSQPACQLQSAPQTAGRAVALSSRWLAVHVHGFPRPLLVVPRFCVSVSTSSSPQPAAVQPAGNAAQPTEAVPAAAAMARKTTAIAVSGDAWHMHLHRQFILGDVVADLRDAQKYARKGGAVLAAMVKAQMHVWEAEAVEASASAGAGAHAGAVSDGHESATAAAAGPGAAVDRATDFKLSLGEVILDFQEIDGARYALQRTLWQAMSPAAESAAAARAALASVIQADGLLASHVGSPPDGKGTVNDAFAEPPSVGLLRCSSLVLATHFSSTEHSQQALRQRAASIDSCPVTSGDMSGSQQSCPCTSAALHGYRDVLGCDVDLTVHGLILSVRGSRALPAKVHGSHFVNKYEPHASVAGLLQLAALPTRIAAAGEVSRGTLASELGAAIEALASCAHPAAPLVPVFAPRPLLAAQSFGIAGPLIIGDLLPSAEDIVPSGTFAAHQSAPAAPHYAVPLRFCRVQQTAWPLQSVPGATDQATYARASPATGSIAAGSGSGAGAQERTDAALAPLSVPPLPQPPIYRVAAWRGPSPTKIYHCFTLTFSGLRLEYGPFREPDMHAFSIASSRLTPASTAHSYTNRIVEASECAWPTDATLPALQRLLSGGGDRSAMGNGDESAVNSANSGSGVPLPLETPSAGVCVPCFVPWLVSQQQQQPPSGSGSSLASSAHARNRSSASAPGPFSPEPSASAAAMETPVRMHRGQSFFSGSPEPSSDASSSATGSTTKHVAATPIRGTKSQSAATAAKATASGSPTRVDAAPSSSAVAAGAAPPPKPPPLKWWDRLRFFMHGEPLIVMHDAVISLSAPPPMPIPTVGGSDAVQPQSAGSSTLSSVPSDAAMASKLSPKQVLGGYLPDHDARVGLQFSFDSGQLLCARRGRLELAFRGAALGLVSNSLLPLWKTAADALTAALSKPLYGFPHPYPLLSLPALAGCVSFRWETRGSRLQAEQGGPLEPAAHHLQLRAARRALAAVRNEGLLAASSVQHVSAGSDPWWLFRSLAWHVHLALRVGAHPQAIAYVVPHLSTRSGHLPLHASTSAASADASTDGAIHTAAMPAGAPLPPPACPTLAIEWSSMPSVMRAYAAATDSFPGVPSSSSELGHDRVHPQAPDAPRSLPAALGSVLWDVQLVPSAPDTEGAAAIDHGAGAGVAGREGGAGTAAVGKPSALDILRHVDAGSALIAPPALPAAALQTQTGAAGRVRPAAGRSDHQPSPSRVPADGFVIALWSHANPERRGLAVRARQFRFSWLQQRRVGVPVWPGLARIPHGFEICGRGVDISLPSLRSAVHQARRQATHAGLLPLLLLPPPGMSTQQHSPALVCVPIHDAIAPSHGHVEDKGGARRGTPLAGGSSRAGIAQRQARRRSSQSPIRRHHAAAPGAAGVHASATLPHTFAAMPPAPAQAHQSAAHGHVAPPLVAVPLLDDAPNAPSSDGRHAAGSTKSARARVHNHHHTAHLTSAPRHWQLSFTHAAHPLAMLPPSQAVIRIPHLAYGTSEVGAALRKRRQVAAAAPMSHGGQGPAAAAHGFSGFGFSGLAARAADAGASSLPAELQRSQDCAFSPLSVHETAALSLVLGERAVAGAAYDLDADATRNAGDRDSGSQAAGRRSRSDSDAVAAGDAAVRELAADPANAVSTATCLLPVGSSMSASFASVGSDGLPTGVEALAAAAASVGATRNSFVRPKCIEMWAPRIVLSIRARDAIMGWIDSVQDTTDRKDSFMWKPFSAQTQRLLAAAAASTAGASTATLTAPSSAGPVTSPGALMLVSPPRSGAVSAAAAQGEATAPPAIPSGVVRMRAALLTAHALAAITCTVTCDAAGIVSAISVPVSPVSGAPVDGALTGTALLSAGAAVQASRAKHHTRLALATLLADERSHALFAGAARCALPPAPVPGPRAAYPPHLLPRLRRFAVARGVALPEPQSGLFDVGSSVGGASSQLQTAQTGSAFDLTTSSVAGHETHLAGTSSATAAVDDTDVVLPAFRIALIEPQLAVLDPAHGNSLVLAGTFACFTNAKPPQPTPAAATLAACSPVGSVSATSLSSQGAVDSSSAVAALALQLTSPSARSFKPQWQSHLSGASLSSDGAAQQQPPPSASSEALVAREPSAGSSASYSSAAAAAAAAATESAGPLRLRRRFYLGFVGMSGFLDRRVLSAQAPLCWPIRPRGAYGSAATAAVLHAQLITKALDAAGSDVHALRMTAAEGGASRRQLAALAASAPALSFASDQAAQPASEHTETMQPVLLDAEVHWLNSIHDFAEPPDAAAFPAPAASASGSLHGASKGKPAAPPRGRELAANSFAVPRFHASLTPLHFSRFVGALKNVLLTGVQDDALTTALRMSVGRRLLAPVPWHARARLAASMAQTAHEMQSGVPAAHADLSHGGGDSFRLFAVAAPPNSGAIAAWPPVKSFGGSSIASTAAGALGGVAAAAESLEAFRSTSSESIRTASTSMQGHGPKHSPRDHVLAQELDAALARAGMAAPSRSQSYAGGSRSHSHLAAPVIAAVFPALLQLVFAPSVAAVPVGAGSDSTHTSADTAAPARAALRDLLLATDALLSGRAAQLAAAAPPQQTVSVHGGRTASAQEVPLGKPPAPEALQLRKSEEKLLRLRLQERVEALMMLAAAGAPVAADVVKVGALPAFAAAADGSGGMSGTLSPVPPDAAAAQGKEEAAAAAAAAAPGVARSRLQRLLGTGSGGSGSGGTASGKHPAPATPSASSGSGRGASISPGPQGGSAVQPPLLPSGPGLVASSSTSSLRNASSLIHPAVRRIALDGGTGQPAGAGDGSGSSGSGGSAHGAPGIALRGRSSSPLPPVAPRSSSADLQIRRPGGAETVVQVLQPAAAPGHALAALHLQSPPPRAPVTSTPGPHQRVGLTAPSPGAQPLLTLFRRPDGGIDVVLPPGSAGAFDGAAMDAASAFAAAAGLGATFSLPAVTGEPAWVSRAASLLPSALASHLRSISGFSARSGDQDATATTSALPAVPLDGNAARTARPSVMAIGLRQTSAVSSDGGHRSEGEGSVRDGRSGSDYASSDDERPRPPTPMTSAQSPQKVRQLLPVGAAQSSLPAVHAAHMQTATANTGAGVSTHAASAGTDGEAYPPDASHAADALLASLLLMLEMQPLSEWLRTLSPATASPPLMASAGQLRLAAIAPLVSVPSAPWVNALTGPSRVARETAMAHLALNAAPSAAAIVPYDSTAAAAGVDADKSVILGAPASLLSPRSSAAVGGDPSWRGVRMGPADGWLAGLAVPQKKYRTKSLEYGIACFTLDMCAPELAPADPRLAAAVAAASREPAAGRRVALQLPSGQLLHTGLVDLRRRQRVLQAQLTGFRGCKSEFQPAGGSSSDYSLGSALFMEAPHAPGADRALASILDGLRSGAKASLQGVPVPVPVPVAIALFQPKTAAQAAAADAFAASTGASATTSAPASGPASFPGATAGAGAPLSSPSSPVGGYAPPRILLSSSVVGRDIGPRDRFLHVTTVSRAHILPCKFVPALDAPMHLPSETAALARAATGGAGAAAAAKAPSLLVPAVEHGTSGAPVPIAWTVGGGGGSGTSGPAAAPQLAASSSAFPASGASVPQTVPHSEFTSSLLSDMISVPAASVSPASLQSLVVPVYEHVEVSLYPGAEHTVEVNLTRADADFLKAFFKPKSRKRKDKERVKYAAASAAAGVGVTGSDPAAKRSRTGVVAASASFEADEGSGDSADESTDSEDPDAILLAQHEGLAGAEPMPGYGGRAAGAGAGARAGTVDFHPLDLAAAATAARSGTGPSGRTGTAAPVIGAASLPGSPIGGFSSLQLSSQHQLQRQRLRRHSDALLPEVAELARQLEREAAGALGRHRFGRRRRAEGGDGDDGGGEYDDEGADAPDDDDPGLRERALRMARRLKATRFRRKRRSRPSVRAADAASAAVAAAAAASLDVADAGAPLSVGDVGGAGSSGVTARGRGRRLLDGAKALLPWGGGGGHSAAATTGASTGGAPSAHTASASTPGGRGAFTGVDIPPSAGPSGHASRALSASSGAGAGGGPLSSSDEHGFVVVPHNAGAAGRHGAAGAYATGGATSGAPTDAESDAIAHQPSRLRALGRKLIPGALRNRWEARQERQRLRELVRAQRSQLQLQHAEHLLGATGAAGDVSGAESEAEHARLATAGAGAGALAGAPGTGESAGAIARAAGLLRRLRKPFRWRPSGSRTVEGADGMMIALPSASSSSSSSSSSSAASDSDASGDGSTTDSDASMVDGRGSAASGSTAAAGGGGAFAMHYAAASARNNAGSAGASASSRAVGSAPIVAVPAAGGDAIVQLPRSLVDEMRSPAGRGSFDSCRSLSDGDDGGAGIASAFVTGGGGTPAATSSALAARARRARVSSGAGAGGSATAPRRASQMHRRRVGSGAGSGSSPINRGATGGISAVGEGFGAQPGVERQLGAVAAASQAGHNIGFAADDDDDVADSASVVAAEMEQQEAAERAARAAAAALSSGAPSEEQQRRVERQRQAAALLLGVRPETDAAFEQRQQQSVSSRGLRGALSAVVARASLKRGSESKPATPNTAFDFDFSSVGLAAYVPSASAYQPAAAEQTHRDSARDGFETPHEQSTVGGSYAPWHTATGTNTQGLLAGGGSLASIGRMIARDGQAVGGRSPIAQRRGAQPSQRPRLASLFKQLGPDAASAGLGIAGIAVAGQAAAGGSSFVSSSQSAMGGEAAAAASTAPAAPACQHLMQPFTRREVAPTRCAACGEAVTAQRVRMVRCALCGIEAHAGECTDALLQLVTPHVSEAEAAEASRRSSQVAPAASLLARQAQQAAAGHADIATAPSVAAAPATSAVPAATLSDVPSGRAFTFDFDEYAAASGSTVTASATVAVAPAAPSAATAAEVVAERTLAAGGVGSSSQPLVSAWLLVLAAADVGSGSCSDISGFDATSLAWLALGPPHAHDDGGLGFEARPALSDVAAPDIVASLWAGASSGRFGTVASGHGAAAALTVPTRSMLSPGPLVAHVQPATAAGQDIGTPVVGGVASRHGRLARFLSPRSRTVVAAGGPEPGAGPVGALSPLPPLPPTPLAGQAGQVRGGPSSALIARSTSARSQAEEQQHAAGSGTAGGQPSTALASAASAASAASPALSRYNYFRHVRVGSLTMSLSLSGFFGLRVEGLHAVLKPVVFHNALLTFDQLGAKVRRHVLSAVLAIVPRLLGRALGAAAVSKLEAGLESVAAFALRAAGRGRHATAAASAAGVGAAGGTGASSGQTAGAGAGGAAGSPSTGEFHLNDPSALPWVFAPSAGPSASIAAAGGAIQAGLEALALPAASAYAATSAVSLAALAVETRADAFYLSPGIHQLLRLASQPHWSLRQQGAGLGWSMRGFHAAAAGSTGSSIAAVLAEGRGVPPSLARLQALPGIADVIRSNGAPLLQPVVSSAAAASATTTIAPAAFNTTVSAGAGAGAGGGAGGGAGAHSFAKTTLPDSPSVRAIVAPAAQKLAGAFSAAAAASPPAPSAPAAPPRVESAVLKQAAVARPAAVVEPSTASLHTVAAAPPRSPQRTAASSPPKPPARSPPATTLPVASAAAVGAVGGIGSSGGVTARSDFSLPPPHQSLPHQYGSGVTTLAGPQQYSHHHRYHVHHHHGAGLVYADGHDDDGDADEAEDDGDLSYLDRMDADVPVSTTDDHDGGGDTGSRRGITLGSAAAATAGAPSAFGYARPAAVPAGLGREETAASAYSRQPAASAHRHEASSYAADAVGLWETGLSAPATAAAHAAGASGITGSPARAASHAVRPAALEGHGALHATGFGDWPAAAPGHSSGARLEGAAASVPPGTLVGTPVTPGIARRAAKTLGKLVPRKIKGMLSGGPSSGAAGGL